MNTVHVVVPEGVDDAGRPSGGNTYDRRVCDGLRAAGWGVHEVHAAGAWPRADRTAHRRLAAELGGLADCSLVLVDGLVASAVPQVLGPEAGRLRLVAVVHLPLGVSAPGSGATTGERADQRAERAALGACRAVVATSRWTRAWLRVHYGLPAGLVAVVPPGTDPAPLTEASASGGRFLCVGALTPTKGQDVLVEALARTRDLAWSCTLVGPGSADPPFARSVARRAVEAVVAERCRFTGALTGSELAELQHRADLLIVPSRMETFGMVVTEAVARGVPVLGSDVGGVPESMGRDRRGQRPGLLVPAGDPDALAGAVRRWLNDDLLRQRLRGVARRRRPGLDDWSVTSEALARVLSAVAA